jgi:hypothetical protein
MHSKVISSLEPDATVHDGADSELVILSPIHPHCCLGTSLFSEGAGHESSVEKMVYVVTGLQVSHEAYAFGAP